mgnify:CR=1 FL=1
MQKLQVAVLPGAFFCVEGLAIKFSGQVRILFFCLIISLFHTVRFVSHSVKYIFHSVVYVSHTVEQRNYACLLPYLLLHWEEMRKRFGRFSAVQHWGRYRDGMWADEWLSVVNVCHKKEAHSLNEPLFILSAFMG